MAQAGLNGKKTGGRKYRWTVPLRQIIWRYFFFTFLYTPVHKEYMEKIVSKNKNDFYHYVGKHQLKLGGIYNSCAAGTNVYMLLL